MRLTLIFDTKIDTPHESIKNLMDSLMRERKGSAVVIQTIEKSLNLDSEEVEIYENGQFVLVRENNRDRLFTKE